MAYYIHLGNGKVPCDIFNNFHVDYKKLQFKKFKKSYRLCCLSYSFPPGSVACRF